MAKKASEVFVTIPTVADIDRVIQTGLVDKTFSAAACIASKDGRIFHHAVYGAPVTPPPLQRIGLDALFDLGSLTKPLGSGLGALLLAGGRLDLGRPIGQILKPFQDSRFAKITIDMLLDHTSGLTLGDDIWQSLREDDKRRHRDAALVGRRTAVPEIQSKVAALPLAAEPGTQTLYSDLNFLLLGWIIEEVVGKPLDVFLESEIYKPHGLADDLFFRRLDETKPRMALAKRQFMATERCPWRNKLLQGEVQDPLAWAIGGVAGHAGLFGTARAVWQLGDLLLNSYHGRVRAFHPGVMARFWTRSKRVANTTRALAWDTPCAQNPSAGKRFARTSVGHLSRSGAAIWIDHTANVIGVLLTNSAHPTPDGKKEPMAKLRPRVFELIASFASALPPLKAPPTSRLLIGSAGGGAVGGPVKPLGPLRK